MVSIIHPNKQKPISHPIIPIPINIIVSGMVLVNRTISCTTPSRLWFLSQGCKQVPPEYTKNIVRWAHPDGYFLNAQGQKIAHSYSPSSRNVRPNMHGRYPRLRECGPDCHLLMALVFYGIRPTYMDIKTGKEYVGICHHIIPDKLDYRPANLLCWLTREQHYEADRRQRELKKILPDMHELSYDEHRRLQDPRVTSNGQFIVELVEIRKRYVLQ